MRTNYQCVVVFDLETGGLDLKKNPLAEVAMVAIDMYSLQIVDEFSCLIKPYNEDLVYEQEAFDVNHLSLELLETEGIDSNIAIESMIKFLDKHTKGNNKPVLSGHNIKKVKGFDLDFLEKFFEDHEEVLSNYHNQHFSIDTLDLAKLKWFELGNYGLGTCSNSVGLTLKEAHRALPDTKANAQLFIKMMQALRGDGESGVQYVRRKFNFNF